MPDKECVKVLVRCRPMNRKEMDRKCKKVIKIDKKNCKISIQKPSEPRKEPKAFTFDAVFDDDSKQMEVYMDSAYGLVQNVLEGYNGTIFAYGQTGCGKTFTMEGQAEPPEMRGIIPNSFDQIFRAIDMNTVPGRQYLVTAAYLEIYNENVRDLLGKDSKKKLELKEDPDTGVFVKGLTRNVVKSVDEINRLMVRGNTNRTTGATKMNAGSSRSHSIFTVRIETSEPDDTPGSDDVRIRAGKMNLVDLAGSERQSKTEAKGIRLKEATKINLSLSALGNVISALVAGKGRHIPYRDSKLTRLLQDSLGGNTKTIMIAALSPADYNYDETLSTLRYANRAKNIKNKPTINEDPKDALLREYQDEIKRLKALLEKQGIDDDGVGPNGGGGGVQVDEEALRRKIEMELRAQLQAEYKSKLSSSNTVSPERKRKKKQRADDGFGDEYDLDDDEYEESIEVEEIGDGGIEETPDLNTDQLFADLPPEEAARREKILQEQLAEKLAIRKREMQAQYQRARERMEKDLARLAQEKAEHERMAAELSEKIQSEEKEKVESLATELAEKMNEEKRKHEELADELSKKMELERKKQEELQKKMMIVQENSKATKSELEERLELMKRQLVEGGAKARDANRMHDLKVQEMLIEKKKHEAEQARLRAEREKAEEEKLLVEENYRNQADELTGKRKKLKRLQKKYKAALEENKDLQTEFEEEREGYLTNIREMYRELRLFKNICGMVLERHTIEKIIHNSKFDEVKDEWKMAEVELEVQFPTVRGERAAPGTFQSKYGGLPPQPQKPRSRGRSTGARSRAGSRAEYEPINEPDSSWRGNSVRTAARQDLHSGRHSPSFSGNHRGVSMASRNSRHPHHNHPGSQSRTPSHNTRRTQGISINNSSRRRSKTPAPSGSSDFHHKPAVRLGHMSHSNKHRPVSQGMEPGRSPLPDDLPRGRGNFEPAGSVDISPRSGGGGGFGDEDDVMRHLPSGRGNFNPADVHRSVSHDDDSDLAHAMNSVPRRDHFDPRQAGGGDNNIDNRDSSSFREILEHAPVNRPNFQPAKSTFGDDDDGSVFSKHNIVLSREPPPREPFNPDKSSFDTLLKSQLGGGSASAGLDFEIPANRGHFEPASPSLLGGGSSFDLDNHNHADIPDVPHRPNFQPNSNALGSSSISSSSSSSAFSSSSSVFKDDNNPLNTKINRPAFNPGKPSFGGTSKMPIGGSSFDDPDNPLNTTINRPSFTPAQPASFGNHDDDDDHDHYNHGGGGGGGGGSFAGFDVPMRPSFRPAHGALGRGGGGKGGGGVRGGHDDDPLLSSMNKVPMKPRFQPANIGVR